MLIHNYGLFWKECDGDWDGGTMWGIYEDGAASETDFASQRGIYILYDPQFKPVYVGQAAKGDLCLFNRIAAHRFDHLRERWTHFSWFGTCPLIKSKPGSDERVVNTGASVSTDLPSTVNHLEAVLIAAMEPPLNLQRGRFGSKVYKYAQIALSDFEK